MSVTDTSPEGGTDSAPPSTEFDTPENWNYYDPDDEKQDTVAAPTAKGTEGEKDASASAAQESDEADKTEEDADPDAEQAEDADEETKLDGVLVTMPDGQQVEVSELRKGYLRQSDYTRGKQDLANRVRWVDDHAHHISTQMQAAEQFLAAVMPQRPDPALAQQNPAQYLAMERYYSDWQNHLAYAQQMASQPQNIMAQISEMQGSDQHSEHLRQESELLKAALPALAEEKGRKEFFVKANEVGGLAGYTPEDLASVTDHRQIVILDLAVEGLAARKAKQSIKAKVANVPPVAPQKRGAPQGTATAKNRDAMQKLSRSGSINDAMMVDFD